MLKNFFKSREESFWNWFKENSKELFEFDPDKNSQEIVSELRKELNKVNPGLVWELGPTLKGKREFTISADGIRKLFPEVIKLVEKAPKIEQWKILAFRQRTNLKNTSIITIDGLKVALKEIYFEVKDDKGRLGITLYIKNYHKEDKRFNQAAFLLLDTLLGEYDVETKIGFIEIFPLAEDKKKLLQLNKLPNIIDRIEPEKTIAA